MDLRGPSLKGMDKEKKRKRPYGREEEKVDREVHPERESKVGVCVVC